MNPTRLAVLGAAFLLALVVAMGSLFTVQQTQQALVLRLGNPMRVVTEPGLHVKTPFIENVVTYDRRVLDLDPPQQQVTLADQKRLNVDAYTRFRIVDPLLFYQTLTTEIRARDRLKDYINGSLRGVMGNADLTSVLSEKRAGVMHEIQQQVNNAAKGFGIEIVDVRIGRADLPDETSQAVYNRMKSEREREAKEFRAEGYELAQQIRADAERQRTVLIADARKQSEIMRGEADSNAIKVWADAANKAPDFFAFYRSMQAYRKALGEGTGTTLVLGPDSEFFKYFGASGAAGKR